MIITNFSNKTHLLDSLAPSYLRINLEPKLISDLTPEELEKNPPTLQKLKQINDWSNEKGFKNIFRLTYNATKWKPKETMQLLSIASDIGITNCSWQFGDGMIFFFKSSKTLTSYDLHAVT